MPSCLTRRFASAAASFDHEYIRSGSVPVSVIGITLFVNSARFVTRSAVAPVSLLAVAGHLLVDWIRFSKRRRQRRQIAQVMIEIGHAL